MNTANVCTLVFDWDGTLIDSIDRIVTSLQKAGREACDTHISEQAARDVIGMGLMDALHQLLPGIEATAVERACELYRQDYLYDSQVPTPLFDGVRECLDDLRARGFQLAIATGKSRLGLDRAMLEHDLGHYFVTTRCAGEYASKPDPEMLLSILDDFELDASQAMMIGDSEHDMRMAHNAGVAAVAVTHGAHDADTLLQYRPLWCLDDITEISNVLNHTCQTPRLAV